MKQPKSKEPSKTGVLILAAGNSSRLGKPKQLLTYKGKGLLQITLDAAKHSKADKVAVVLGAHHQMIQEKLVTGQVELLINDQWEKGMSTSLQMGIAYFTEVFPVDRIVVLLCDQPFVDAELIKELLSTQTNTEQGIVCSRYGNAFGVPAVFTKNYFPKIMDLKGQEGAKKIIMGHIHDLEYVEFPKGNIDIDTEQDYLKLVI